MIATNFSLQKKIENYTDRQADIESLLRNKILHCFKVTLQEVLINFKEGGGERACWGTGQRGVNLQ